jgi:flagellar motility protein MotE (MotC chaperone)
MNTRSWLWILIPITLSAGVLWLSAQEAKPSEGLKLGELAEKLQTREKAVAKKEADLQQMEQRLAVLQSTLDRDRQDLQNREKGVQEAAAKLEQERTRPVLDPQLTRTYEAMDPVAGAAAMKELAAINPDVAVSLLGSMAAKKAGKLMDQLAVLDPKLAGRLSERVGLTKDKPRPPA